MAYPFYLDLGTLSGAWSGRSEYDVDLEIATEIADAMADNPDVAVWLSDNQIVHRIGIQKFTDHLFFIMIDFEHENDRFLFRLAFEHLFEEHMRFTRLSDLRLDSWMSHEQ